MLAICPVAYLLVFLIGFTVDVPYWDQWDLVPLLQKMDDGSLSLNDLWSQHNEHRLLFPRLVMLVLARISDWNIYLEYAVSFVLASLTCIALSIFFVRTS